MLKLKKIQTKPVIYQGLAVDVPVDTNYMWLSVTSAKTVLWASSEKPSWCSKHNLYSPPSDTTKVAELENTDLTVEQVKNSLETNEDLPAAQDEGKLDVVKNLIKNLRSFADCLERNVAKASLNPTSENLHALFEHVYLNEGELDNFYNNAIQEASAYDLIAEQDEDSEEDEDLEDLLKFVKIILN